MFLSRTNIATKYTPEIFQCFSATSFCGAQQNRSLQWAAEGEWDGADSYASVSVRFSEPVSVSCKLSVPLGTLPFPSTKSTQHGKEQKWVGHLRSAWRVFVCGKLFSWLRSLVPCWIYQFKSRCRFLSILSSGVDWELCQSTLLATEHPS